MQGILMEFIELYKTSFIIIIAIIAFTIQVIVFNDPPSFPLSDYDESSIDCFNIISSTIKIEKSRIKVTMDVKDFIQYPIEVASSMVHIESKSGNVNFSFSSDQFWDLKSDLHHISFCALQTAAGQVEASLYCQKNLLSKSKNRIRSLDAYPVGWSRLFEDDYFSASFTDVCISSKLNLVFCSKQNAKISNIRASWSEEVPVFITSKSASNYQQSEKIGILEDFSVFVPFNSNIKKTLNSSHSKSYLPTNPQDFLIDTILPVIGSLTFSPNSFIVPNEKIKQQLIPILGSKVNLISKKCYKKLTFLPTTGGFNVVSMKKYHTYQQALGLHIKFLLSFSKETFNQIKQFYPTQSKSESDDQAENKKYDIVVDQISNQFIDIVNDSLSKEVFVINDNQSFNSVANIISSAKILIASNIKTLFFGSLMSNRSTIIEVVPDGMNCFIVKDLLSSKFDTNYKVLNNNIKDCICKDSKDLDCYFRHEHKYNQVDRQKLLKLIHDSLK